MLTANVNLFSFNVRTQERSPGQLSAVNYTRRVLLKKFQRRRDVSTLSTNVVLSVLTLMLFKLRELKSLKFVPLLVKKPSSKLRKLKLLKLMLPKLKCVTILNEIFRLLTSFLGSKEVK